MQIAGAELAEILLRGEFTLNGFRNRMFREQPRRMTEDEASFFPRPPYGLTLAVVTIDVELGRMHQRKFAQAA